MPTITPPSSGFAKELESYLEASTEKYSACLAALDPDLSIGKPATTLRFQHLRFDGNGRPKFAELARVLAQHIVEYSFSAKRRGNPVKSHEHAKILQDARRYFRKFSTSGEAGEILLYFLLEAILGAPQLVAKMELKTNPKLENHGSDGIHMRWHSADDTLDVYFGEAKLEQTVSAAIRNMLRSLEKFHRDGLLEFELGLVTSHYKHANETIRAEVLNLIDSAHPSGNCRINHACLIGYNWDEYGKLDGVEIGRLEVEFRKRYEEYLPELVELLKQKLGNFSQPKIRFEIFLLPFDTVQGFRDAFNEAL
jgi:hypothetical protein